MVLNGAWESICIDNKTQINLTRYLYKIPSGKQCRFTFKSY